ncbi:MAG: ABC transporter permease [Candidatus Diapherotrites archaeon]|uniref:ABC transporter permease n=1 Tax=Candidatus Iainarchaeum sp. TaxID=3101447 RepID=A0A8T3YNL1_9ARCH|nr:ABC transporter permease [Candidatus Diapherotrites archaeon]
MIKLSFLNIFRRKTRAVLAIAGIAIGVAAIIVLVSLVDGFTSDFNDVISQFKGVTVYEKNSADQTLSKIDASLEQKIEALPNVKAVIPEIWVLPNKIDSEPIGLSPTGSVAIYGLDTGKYFANTGSSWLNDIGSGAVLKGSDRGQVMIGEKIAEDFQKFPGSAIKINETVFRVKAVLKGESDLLSGIIIMNIDDARSLSSLVQKDISSITVIVSDVSKDKEVASLIKAKYGADVQAFTQDDLSEQFTGIIGNLRLLAVAIALISGIVAGIGIANTMLMNVLERFREIGALKAVGWTNANIMKMVLYEALILGFMGGTAGILLGFAVDQLLFSVAGVKFLISPPLLLSSFAFAVVLGAVSGLYPAYHASRLDPIEALRG